MRHVRAPSITVIARPESTGRIGGNQIKAQRQMPRLIKSHPPSHPSSHWEDITMELTRRHALAGAAALAAAPLLPQRTRQGRRADGRQAGAELLSLQGRRRAGHRRSPTASTRSRCPTRFVAQREEGRGQRGAREGLHAEGQDVASSSRRWSSTPAASWSSSTPATAAAPSHRARATSASSPTNMAAAGHRSARRSTWWSSRISTATTSTAC